MTISDNLPMDDPTYFWLHQSERPCRSRHYFTAKAAHVENGLFSFGGALAIILVSCMRCHSERLEFKIVPPVTEENMPLPEPELWEVTTRLRPGFWQIDVLYKKTGGIFSFGATTQNDKHNIGHVAYLGDDLPSASSGLQEN